MHAFSIEYQSYCPKITKNLQKGHTDKTTQRSVTELQKFLNAYFEKQAPLVGGTFGPKTEQAVKDFQKKVGLTGLGVVGPLTRKAIANECSKNVGTTANSTATGYTLEKSAKDFSEVATVVGPSSLLINEAGTWNIQFKDSLVNKEYVVRFGDEPSTGDVTNPYNWPALGFATKFSSLTFSHSYKNKGTYTLQVCITKNDGNPLCKPSTIIVGN